MIDEGTMVRAKRAGWNELLLPEEEFDLVPVGEDDGAGPMLGVDLEGELRINRGDVPGAGEVVVYTVGGQEADPLTIEEAPDLALAGVFGFAPITIFQDDGSELELAFNPSQSRDTAGRFGEGGPGGLKEAQAGVTAVLAAKKAGIATEADVLDAYRKYGDATRALKNAVKSQVQSGVKEVKAAVAAGDATAVTISVTRLESKLEAAETKLSPSREVAAMVIEATSPPPSGEWESSLSDQERDIARSWVDGKYGAIRKQELHESGHKTWDGANAEDAERVRVWNESLDRAPVHEGVVYRGLPIKSSQRSYSLMTTPGSEFEWNNSSSASSSSKVARSFAMEGVLFKIKTKTSVRLGGLNAAEDEVVLRRDVKYRVTKSEAKPQRGLGPWRVVHLEEL